MTLTLCAALLGPGLQPAAAQPPLPELPSEHDLDAAMDAGAGAGTAQLSGLSLQAWGQHAIGRDDYASTSSVRGVVDYARTWQVSPRWTARLSNELDVVGGQAGPDRDTSHVINTLREAWAGWRSADAATQYYIDMGRINVRHGVGSGYNPTDFFKRNAVNRAATTLDPGALRENRMGTVMVRGQLIGERGAFMVGLAPRLAHERAPGDVGSDTSPALDRTNGRAAAYVKWAPQLSERVSLDVLALGREHERPQAGLNVSVLGGDAIVLNAEWSGARRVSLAGPGQGPVDAAWRNRAALNVVWTTPLGPELTVERQYAGDALGRAAWRDWRDVADPAAVRQLLGMLEARQLEQEPLTRAAWFVRLHWRDAFSVRGFDVACFTQHSVYDGSAVSQASASGELGARWRAGLLLAHYSGAATSEYGGSPVRTRLAAYLNYRF